MAVPPFCQSPLVLFVSVVMSVRYSEGMSGRREASTPAWAPVVAVAPTPGFVAELGLVLRGLTVYIVAKVNAVVPVAVALLLSVTVVAVKLATVVPAGMPVPETAW